MSRQYKRLALVHEIAISDLREVLGRVPPDAQVVQAWTDPDNGNMVLLIEHESFARVEYNESYPVIDPDSSTQHETVDVYPDDDDDD